MAGSPFLGADQNSSESSRYENRGGFLAEMSLRWLAGSVQIFLFSPRMHTSGWADPGEE